MPNNFFCIRSDFISKSTAFIRINDIYKNYFLNCIKNYLKFLMLYINILINYLGIRLVSWTLNKIFYKKKFSFRTVSFRVINSGFSGITITVLGTGESGLWNQISNGNGMPVKRLLVL